VRRLAAVALALALPATTASAGAGVAGVGARVGVVPLGVSLALSTHRAKVGDGVRAQATASNLGPDPLADVALTLRGDPSGLALSGAATQVVPALAPGGSASVTWTVCGVEPGSYVLLVRGTFARPTGEVVAAESSAELLEVLTSQRTTCRG
jgi:alpha-galactosidase-like protein